MMAVMSVAESAEFIYRKADHVTVDQEALKNLSCQMVRAFKSNKFSMADWKKHALHPKEANKAAVDFIFVMDSLNFSFWTDKEVEATNGKYTVTFDGIPYTGYFALVAAMKRAIEVDKVDISDPSVYSGIDERTLENLLRSDTKTPIPMLKERLEILHSNGKILIDEFGGSFSNVITAAESSAGKLLELIITKFPCFNDHCLYKKESVYLHKRAQILISDIWSCYEGHGLGFFSDIDSLTMFADYRVPQILNFFGVIKYSNQLMDALKKNTNLQFGDPMEVEIRGVSIHAVELLKKEMIEQFKTTPDDKIVVNSILIDYYLWDMRREKCKEIDAAGIPFHKTRSIFY